MVKPSILLIDDKASVLKGLAAELSQILLPDEAEVRQWIPGSADAERPQEAFEHRVDESTVFVATDHDLTTGGIKGLFAPTIVAWCAKLSVPVGDFSRGNVSALPRDPDLFELRIPSTDKEGARSIASAFRGFHDLRTALFKNADLLDSNPSLPTVLATLLQRPHLEAQFSLYMSRVGTANSALVQRIRTLMDRDTVDDERIRLTAYVLGHLLINSILRFSGPIVSLRALCAHIGTNEAEEPDVVRLFHGAIYTGPFAGSNHYYWREEIDSILDDFAAGAPPSAQEDVGDWNRLIVETKLGRALQAHQCERKGCNGQKRGGRDVRDSDSPSISGISAGFLSLFAVVGRHAGRA